MSELHQSIRDLCGAFEAFQAHDAAWKQKFQTALAIEQRRGDKLESDVNGGMMGGAFAAPEAARLEMNNALREVLRSGKLDPLRQFSPQGALTVGSDPGGGYVVLPEVERGISSILRDISPFRRLARIRPVRSGDAFEERFSLGGAAAVWVGETQARTATANPELKKLRVPLNESYAMPEATQKLVDDADTDIVDWLNQEVGIAFAEQEGVAFVSGDGVLKPRGLLTYPISTSPDASRTWGELQYVATGASGAFDSTDPGDVFHDAVAALKTGYRPNARWVMNRQTWSAVRKLKGGTTSEYLLVPDFAGAPPDRLLGYPVELDENMPAIAANSLSIAFGDFRQGYVIADRPGLRLLVDPYTNKPMVRLYTYRRVGGDVRDFNSIKLIRFAAS